MNSLLCLSKKIDALNEWIGRAAVWLVLAVTLLGTFNAIMRYTVSYSSNAFLEGQWYLFGAIFMLCSGYTLLHDAHVRVDVLLERFSARTKAWIDIVGIIFFLMPMAFGSMLLSWPIFVDVFRSGEMSNSPGGLIVWPARLLIPVGFFLIILQGFSELIKRIDSLKRRDAAPEASGKEAAK
ncbi:MAG: TRAP transporter small permease subunit [Candidatus Accumulibacter sp.]|nr:TRAP transporter small permease subunit [Accumulibacter sp.]